MTDRPSQSISQSFQPCPAAVRGLHRFIIGEGVRIVETAGNSPREYISKFKAAT